MLVKCVIEELLFIYLLPNAVPNVEWSACE